MDHLENCYKSYYEERQLVSRHSQVEYLKIVAENSDNIFTIDIKKHIIV